MWMACRWQGRAGRQDSLERKDASFFIQHSACQERGWRPMLSQIQKQKKNIINDNQSHHQHTRHNSKKDTQICPAPTITARLPHPSIESSNNLKPFATGGPIHSICESYIKTFPRRDHPMFLIHRAPPLPPSAALVTHHTLPTSKSWILMH